MTVKKLQPSKSKTIKFYKRKFYVQCTSSRLNAGCQRHEYFMSTVILNQACCYLWQHILISDTSTVLKILSIQWRN